MSLIERCAAALRPLLQEKRGAEVPHHDALKVARRVFEEAREPPEEVLLAMCQFECTRSACRSEHACQGHSLRYHKQRWEIAVSTILGEDEDCA